MPFPYHDESKIKTFVDLLETRVQQQPEQQLYTFLLDGETEEAHLTTAALAQHARRIAAALQELDMAGERALLLYPPGLDYIAAFFGCLYGNVVAVPAYPPNPAALNRTLPRLQAIVTDAQATVALTTSPILAMAEMIFGQSAKLQALQWIATDTLTDDSTSTWHKPTITADTLAFLQYTSGSTGDPKGVMLSHANLLHNSALIHQCFGHTATSQGVIWLPPYHDMGLIGGILQPLYGAFPVTLMSPLDFLRKPLRWLQAISRYGATTSGGPNFAYDLCVRKVSPEQAAELDLSSWTLAFNGAEPIRQKSLERFAEAFTSSGFRREAFYPCYGLAEVTLIASGGEKAEEPIVKHFDPEALKEDQAVKIEAAEEATTLISCGRTLPEQQIVIAEPDSGRRCGEGQIGEIWLSGPSVAQGYWQRPEETAVNFAAQITPEDKGPFLRTGDLGFLQDGELFVTGRIKDLIIIRGQNHYPQDIEKTAELSHPAIRPGCGAAFSLDVDGQERLILIYEIQRKIENPDYEAITATVREAVALSHEVQLHNLTLVKPGTIPKTSSGKIQRYACRQAFIDEELETLSTDTLTAAPTPPPATTPTSQPKEESFIRKSLLAVNDRASRQALLRIYLQEQISQAMPFAAGQLAPDRSLASLGLDSLTAIELTNEIETSLQIQLPMVTLLAGPTLDELIDELLNRLDHKEVIPALTSNDLTEYRLSHGQKALWFLTQLAPDNAAYNISRAVKIRSRLDEGALKRAFTRLVERHAILRTVFHLDDNGQPEQKILAEPTLDWQVVEAQGWSEEQVGDYLREEAQRPFSLNQPPLFRIHLLQHGPQEHTLLLVIHHIITDFWSLIVMLDEVSTLYAAEVEGQEAALPTPEHQYLDYVQQQEALLAGSEGERLLGYWQEQLAGELPLLNLPTDRPRPPVQSYNGAVYTNRFDPDLVERLKELANQEGVTLYMFLLAAFQLLLHRYSGQDDILVGSPTAGRHTADQAGLLGYFVNPVVVRTDFSHSLTFRQLLQEVRQSVLGAFQHQRYPFPLLVEQLNQQRNPSHSPVFQALFALQKAQSAHNEKLTALALGEAGVAIELGTLQLESLALNQQAAQFDLSLMVAELEGQLAASWEYNSDLFAEATIARLAQHFTILLENIGRQFERPIDKLPLLTAEEKTRFAAWNETAVDYAPPACLHHLVEAQVARTPAATALIYEGQALSYQELNERANQLAHQLRAWGVGPETVVGLGLERSLEMVIGLLGILKAGGAYLPLDPTYPAERLSFMREDTQTEVILTQEHLAETFAGLQGHKILFCLDSEWDKVAQQPTTNPTVDIEPLGLAYVIYTSGSTGRPKGVMNNHQAIINRLLWMQEMYQLGQSDAILQKTPFSFDVSGWEFFWPLLAGARLVMARPGGHLDSRYLAEIIQEQQITTLHFVPSMLQIFLDEEGVEKCTTLRRVICSGEALPYDLQERFFERLDAELHNLYGPTEAAIDVTYWACRPDDPLGKVPIGRPIANIQLHILDSHLQVVPQGVAGELHIGGLGLARGYMSRPGLTAARFIPDHLTDTPGQRLYKTGDLARYLPDGAIEFLGRVDFQVKLRGFRIELGEVETRLLEHTAVREAVVLLREDRPGDQRLVAYLVPDGDEAPSANQLRHFLQDKLPDYMIPALFMTLEALPLSTNGKVRRQALPRPQVSRDELNVPYVAPRNQMEQVIAEIWQEALQVEQVGRHDNFFDLGGHSLLLVQVHRQLQEKLEYDFPLTKLLERTTVHALAGYLTETKDEGPAFQKSVDRAAKQRASRRRRRAPIR